mmetsp:Transcript_22540/g.49145  ORF Transcript_22540/g.49145 Transcript_22540/m.49145 type:complete len:96 (+) Transcript_22540:488-775(+)
MSLREYSSLMKEAGLSDATIEGVTRVQLTHTHRLDEKWERIAANAAAETLRMLSELVDPAKVLLYSMAASFLLLATAKVIRTLKTGASNGDDGQS